MIEDNNVDKRNILDEESFSYKITKDNKVFLYWHGKQVNMLRNKESEHFITKVKNVDTKEAQLIMAKLTGNFKRGNEKGNKK